MTLVEYLFCGRRSVCAGDGSGKIDLFRLIYCLVGERFLTSCVRKMRLFIFLALGFICFCLVVFWFIMLENIIIYRKMNRLEGVKKLLIL